MSDTSATHSSFSDDLVVNGGAIFGASSIAAAAASSAPPPGYQTKITVSSGVTESGIAVGSGIDVAVASGGAVISSTVLSGGLLDVTGSAMNNTIYGNEIDEAGAVVKNELVAGVSPTTGTTLIARAGSVVSNLQIAAYGLGAIRAGAELNNATMISGGALHIFQGAIIDSGSVIAFDGQPSGIYGPNSDAYLAGLTVYTSSGGDVLSGAVISGFANHGDTIAVGNYITAPTTIQWTQDTVSGGTLEISQAGVNYDFHLLGTYVSSAFHVTNVGGAEVATYTLPVCFLPGTLIETPEGPRAVETLTAGDRVVHLQDGREVSAEIVWHGAGTVSSAQGGHPIRIRAGAFGDGLPARDLLVTPEHCLYLAGGFVPARMLVNGRSIVEAREIASYEIHHVECAAHAIIRAEGVWTESYLDTGNRRIFDDAARIVPAKSWEKDAAAPLLTERETVETLWREISDRAAEAGLPDERAPLETTEDADLHLVIGGMRLDPIRTAGDVVMFRLPAGATSVRIRSRACAPAQAIGPYVDDRRCLGVLVSDVTLWEGDRMIAITSHLDQNALQGWHEAEDSAMRWTAGDALLPLTRNDDTTSALLGLRIAASGPYLLEDAGMVASAA